MKKKTPNNKYNNKPSYYTAIATAYNDIKDKEYKGKVTEKNLTIPKMDEFLNENISIKYKKFIEHPYRTKLSKFDKNIKAIVLLEKNLEYVYVNGNTYYSFTDLGDSNIMCIWCIEELNKPEQQETSQSEEDMNLAYTV